MARETAAAMSQIRSMSVKTDGPEAMITTLSGGNQQKCIIGRCMLTNPESSAARRPDARRGYRRKSGTLSVDGATGLGRHGDYCHVERTAGVVDRQRPDSGAQRRRIDRRIQPLRSHRTTHHGSRHKIAVITPRRKDVLVRSLHSSHKSR